MRRLNVLFITSWYPSREQPLRGIFVREHAKAVALYADVVVLHCPEPDPNPGLGWQCERETDLALTQGITTYRSRYRISPLPKTSYLVYLWAALRAFRHIVASGFRPDVIHAHIYEAGVPASLIGKLCGIPVVVTEHYSAFLRKSLTRGELRKASFAFRSARWVLPVSAALQRGIEGHGIAARFQVVPNVVDVALFAPLARQRETHDPRRLLFVGTLVPIKGVSYLLQALVQLRQEHPDTSWEMDIVGNGPQREAYERQAAELGLAGSVTFHDAKAKSEIAAFMGRADLLVLPSLAETFSVVVAEALTAGLPVLATACGGPQEIITADAGLLVPPRDADALCAGLSRMLENLHEYSGQCISQHAVDRFSPQVVGRALHAIYVSSERR